MPFASCHHLTVLPLVVYALIALSASAAENAALPATWTDFRTHLQSLGYGAAAGRLPKAPPKPSDSCVSTCAVLRVVLGDAFILPAEVYWSAQQTETIPKCRIQPKSAQDVAAALLITKYFQCPFAVKSGGHACFAGASNIQGGLTIDLAGLNGLEVSSDKKTTKTGAGNRWIDVYSKLDQQQLSVVGGRVAEIGVGGLTLGGGISFFSGRYGWALDGVQNYQTVIANGSIIDVNQQSHPDLYYALRGGGNNFGIVTRFDYDTFPQGKLWGGMRNYAQSANTSLIPAFVDFSHDAPTDPDAALIFNYAYVAAPLNAFLFNIDLEYAKPTPDPPIFKAITAIPALSSTTRITPLADLALELGTANPNGFRESYKGVSLTFSPNDRKKDTALVTNIVDIFTAELTALTTTHPLITGLVPALTLQPITTAMIHNFGRNGGNCLGISTSNTPAPLLIAHVSFRWSLATDDAAVLDTRDRIITRVTQLGRDMGMGNRYIYQNYASKEQGVFAGYGDEALGRLRRVREMWDPSGVFTRLQPGYFKIP